MRIIEVYIKEYGPHRDLHLPSHLFSSPITVFYGLNEAGKSTVHCFIRNLLFYGAKKSRRKEDKQGPCVGYIKIETEKGVVRIERLHDAHRNEWLITDQQGRTLTPDDLPYDVKNYETLYRTVFAFDHSELQAIEELQDESFSTYIYGAAFGGGQANLWALEKEWTKQMDRLFRPRASLPAINQLLGKLYEKQRALAEASERVGQYQPLRQELDRLQQSCQHQQQELHRCMLEREWVKAKLEMQQIEQEINRIDAQKSLLAEQLENIYLPPQQMDALHAERAAIEEMEAEALQVTQELKRLTELLQEQAQALGIDDWREAPPPLSIKDEEAGTEMADRIQRLEQQLQALSKELDVTEDQLEQVAARIQRLHSAQKQSRAGHRRRSSWPLILPIMILMTLLLPAILYLSEQPLTALVTFFCFACSSFMIYHFWRRMESAHRLQGREPSGIEQQVKLEIEQEVQEKLIKQKKRLNKQIEDITNDRDRLAVQFEQWQQDVRIPPVYTTQALGQCFQTLRNMQRDQRLYHQLLEKKRKLDERCVAWCRQVQLLGGSDSSTMIEAEAPSVHRRSVAYYLSQFELLDRRYTEQKNLLKQIEHFRVEQAQLQRRLEQLRKEWDQKHVPEGRTIFERVNAEDVERLRHNEQTLRRELEELSRKRGAIESRIIDLEQETILPTLQQEFEECKAELREEARQWCMYAVARSLCQRTRKMYEEEKQPQVLREASTFFQFMTEGTYTRVIRPFDQERLYVLDQRGKRWDVTSLSQGAKEQLYLSLRFALVKVLQLKAPCPLILDEIFVHFDYRRLERALRAVKELSKTNQVILFTCHPHLVEYSKRVCADIGTFTIGSKELLNVAR